MKHYLKYLWSRFLRVWKRQDSASQEEEDLWWWSNR